MPPSQAHGERVDAEHVDREGADHDAHVGGELAEHVVAEPRGQREDQAEDAEGGQPDHAIEQPHHDVVDTLQRLLEPARRLAAHRREPHAEQQREHHHREHVALGHRADDVVGHESQQQLDPRRRPAPGGRAAGPRGGRASSGERPRPGSNRFTSETPSSTAIADTATV